MCLDWKRTPSESFGGQESPASAGEELKAEAFSATEAGVGMPPPPVNPNHMPSFAVPSARPGFPMPATMLRPGFPAAIVRPAVPGMAVVNSQPKRRAWSPHVGCHALRMSLRAEAGSRAIATASKDEEARGEKPFSWPFSCILVCFRCVFGPFLDDWLGSERLRVPMSSDSERPKRRRLAVPPVLQGLFKREERPEEHGGRARRVAHVEGNFATLAFLKVTPTSHGKKST